MQKLIFTRLLACVIAMAVLSSSLLGCNLGSPLSSSLIPYSERIRISDESISDAVSAFNKGDQARGDADLNRAVVLLTDSLEGEFHDEGYIEVAKQIGAKGRPQDAVRLLEPLTKDDRVAGDPRLWATLADVAKKAALLPQADEARKRAGKEAALIVDEFGKPVINEKDAQKRSERATHAGQYFDEFAHDYHRSLAAYREAYRLLPNDPAIRNNLGYALADRGTTQQEFNEAVELTRSVVEKNSDHPVFLNSFGWALYKRNAPESGDLVGAQWRLREAVDFAPNIPECHYHLAVVYEKLNRLPDALREADYATTLNPDYTEARALIEHLKPLVNALPTFSPNPSPSP